MAKAKWYQERHPDPTGRMKELDNFIRQTLIDALPRTLKDALREALVNGMPRNHLVGRCRKAGATDKTLTLLGIEAYIDTVVEELGIHDAIRANEGNNESIVVPREFMLEILDEVEQMIQGPPTDHPGQAARN
jgi:hypothetical protein